MIEIKKHNTTNISYSQARNLLNHFNLSDSIEQSEREELFIKDICKRVSKSKSVLYVLKIDNINLGLISISVTAIEEFPSLQIDFIFVDKDYRGQQIQELDNLKVSEYLIELVISIAKDIQNHVGLKYIVLLPDNMELERIYRNLNFEKFNTNDWMYLPI